VDSGDQHIGAIGRGPELESIARFLAALPTGPSALVMEGEAGIGKTTLWNEGVASATRTSFTVLSARPALAEAELPYLSLSDLLTEVPDQLLAELPVPQRKALDVALLRTEEEHPLQQRAVSVAVLNALLLLARSTPVLVAIDDAQWLDPPTSRVLRFAIRRLPPTSIGIMIAIRTGSTDEDPLGLGSALPAERVHRLPVGPLDAEALEHLLRSRLHATFSGPTLRRLQQTSGGNPFFALELGRVLDPDTSAAPGRPLPAPRTLTDLLGVRLQRLPTPAKRALLVASALSRPTVDLVCATSVDAEATSKALDRAVEAGLITVRDGSVRFVHPLFASVVYSQASAAELRRLHERLAGIVTDAEERARHLGLAARGPDVSVADAMDVAARRAAARGAQDAAASYKEQAARLTPTGAASDVSRRRVDAADHHVAAGDTARARVLLEEVVDTSHAGRTRARALHRLSRVRVLEGGFGAAPPLLRQALEEVGEDSALRAAIERDLVFTLTQMGALSEALPHARAGLIAAEASGQPALLADALNHLCMAEFLVGHRIDQQLLDRAIATDGQVGPTPLQEHPGMGTGRLPLAITLRWADRFDDARDLLRSLHREHLDHGDEGSLTAVLFGLGELECWAGNWQEAQRLADEGHEVARRTGQAVTERVSLALEAMVEACWGHVDVARTKAESALVLSERADDPRFVIRNLKTLGFIDLSIGDPGGALGYFGRGLELERDAGYDPCVLRLVPDAVEAMLAMGRLEAARPLIEALEDNGRRLDRPWALATGARCRGLLEAASGDLAKAEASLERSLAEHERLPQPFELARTLLAMGVVLRRSKQKRRAREALGRALIMFDELEAALWVERARVELGRIGGRAASPFDLTPTEEGIAGLIAQGYTNREVAETMFLSVKTVESNLTRVYRKLGVSSRRELARRIHSG
jgi:DNA-binding CsgD family transcriptional regulator